MRRGPVKKKIGIFYQEKAFQARKKIRKNDFAPSVKYSSYAPGLQSHKKTFLVFYIIVLGICKNTAKFYRKPHEN